MTSHSTYSASAAYRWLSCPGSLALTKQAPTGRGSGTAAMRGTAAHEVAAEYLQGPDDVPVDCEGREVEVEGTRITLDDDLASQVATYVEYVRSIEGLRLVEVQSNYATSLGLDQEEAWGTADAVVVQDRTVYNIDLKTGRTWVGATNNTQMLLYTAGVAEALDAIGLWEDVDEVVLVIVQPAVKDAPDEWRLTRAEFEAEIAKLKERAAVTEQALLSFTGLEDEVWAERYLRPSEDACKFCPAASFCPALRKATEIANQKAEVLMLSQAKLNDAVARIPLIEAWIEAIQAEAYRQAAEGKEGLDFKLVLGRQGNRRWADEAAAEKRLLEMVERDKVFTQPKLKTPSQVEKALPKGFKLDEELVVRSPAKPTLVAKEDPRPAWSENNIADEFEVVK